MSIIRNKRQVIEFYAAFDNRQIDQALEMLASNFVAHMAGMPEPLDAEAFKAFGMTFYAAFTNSHHQFEQVIATEDQVITCGTFHATHLGGFQGLPPTGQRIKLDVMHIDRLEQGEIVEHWGQGDALGLMQQLGIVFLPGPKLVPTLLKYAASNVLKRFPKHS
ncbi:ester cyclase [Acaryochloris sp. IP29b_bin.137]|uniref:ester cyclase n=1 Tax=Acaryochloris sp. IP29b_bin.137 TaxID=2969217 RepID=UPI002639D2ED|nr:ester cyclase [Acaryochloris sp. IP29b_bin.137]